LGNGNNGVPDDTAMKTPSYSPLVFIVVLNWNGKDDTIECLRSLQKLDYQNYEIVVIDNGSSDGSEDAIRSLFLSVKVVQTGSNLGYATGNNVGISYALSHGAEYVWLLNNDTTVEQNALKTLVATAKTDSQIAFVGSKIYFYDKPNVIWCVGGTINLVDGGRTDHPGIGQVDTGQFENMSDVGYVSGCSLLASKYAISAIGLIPEEYFLYFEETDWNLVAQRKGFRTVLAPSSIVWHKYAEAVDYKDRFIYYSFRNRIHIVRKYEPLYIFKAVQVNLSLLRGYISATPRRAGILCLIAFLAHIDFLLSRFGKTKWQF
jgi:GT2 family glycosyltransferase